MEYQRPPVGHIADFYQLLASCFLKTPEPRWVLGAKDAIGKLLLAGICISELEAVFECLKEKQSLMQDYYDLMFVPQSGSYVPPYESAVANGYYRNDGSYHYGNLASEQEADVARYYGQLGFRWKNLDIFNPLKLIPFADHIGFELAFLGFLAYQEQAGTEDGASENAEQYRKWRSGFLTAHLGRWVSQYADLVIVSSKSPYYRSLVGLTRELVKLDLSSQVLPLGVPSE
ncbi:MAG: molecular chaperone TorD family protein [Negativicutes bacterium]|nr:molecular chaperone TorD family protein [Negativicutes bacterium]